MWEEFQASAIKLALPLTLHSIRTTTASSSIHGTIGCLAGQNYGDYLEVFSTCVTYRPPSGAGTVSGDVVACSSILAGATLLAVKTVATGWAPLATTATRESRIRFRKRRKKTKDKRSSKQGLKHRGMKEMLVLTKRPSIPADRCILLSRGRRSRH